MHDMVRDVALLIASKNDHIRTLSYVKSLNEEWEEDRLSGELNLEKFHITIGCKRERVRNYDGIIKINYFRLLELKVESESCLDDWITILLKRSEEVYLEGSVCSKVLQSELLDANSFLPLRNLWIFYNSEFQHFIHEKNKPLRKCLSKLEFLYLKNLENLESVIHGYNHGESPFNNLKNVIVWNCNKLKTLFLNCMLDDVSNLEEIEINYCKKMEVMITVKENEKATNHIEFTHLKSLCLWTLPRLQKFCSKIEKFGQLGEDNSKNLKTSTISNTINIDESFFSEEVSLPNLEKLKIWCIENLKMIWSYNILIPNSFSKLKEIDIYSCNNLQKVLFSPNMMRILTCLKVLRIEDCKLLEGIFEVQEPISFAEASRIVLQNLSELKLYKLPNLEYVWSKNPCELLSLVNIKSLTIDECPRLRREYSVKILKQLETLSIDIKQLMEVIGKKKLADYNRFESKQLETSSSKVEVLPLGDGSELFPKLKTLKLYGFVEDNSTHLPMEIVQTLYQFEKFELEGAFIEEIFPSNILIPVKKHYYARRSKTSQRSWVLSKLPKLRHLGSECSQKNNDSVLQDLTSLSISECGGLSSLVSSSVSFTNLTFIKFNKCDGLTHLLNPSIASTLVQLKQLRIEECKRMSCIIEGGSAEEDGNDEIINDDAEESKEMMEETDTSIIIREYWDSRLPNLFGEQTLEDSPFEHSSSNKVEE
uniref:Disease resistance protein At4g27190-like leucine-rich repeats domain-containing protein n=1 Tax=Cucumis melo TaxID=3656 RepID=A0A9I9EB32_CUCME